MRKIVDILNVVVRLVLALRLFPGLAGVDALQDAQPPAQKCQWVTNLHSKRAENTNIGNLVAAYLAARVGHLNSESLSCSFFSAWLRVMCCTAFPACPCRQNMQATQTKQQRSVLDKQQTCWEHELSKDHTYPLLLLHNTFVGSQNKQTLLDKAKQTKIKTADGSSDCSPKPFQGFNEPAEVEPWN